MGIFERLRKAKKKNIEYNMPEEEILPLQTNDETSTYQNVGKTSDYSFDEIDDTSFLDDSYEPYGTTEGDDSLRMFEHSDIIADEVIKKVKEINDLDYIGDELIKKMEQYPELVDLLLKVNISREILIFLDSYIKVSYLPRNEEDLKYYKFLDLDEKLQKQLSLLNNRISPIQNENDYIKCYMDLDKEMNSMKYSNEIESFIPGMSINLGTELLTKISYSPSFILYLPKEKHRIVRHDFDQFITGKIELDENTIVQMTYDDFRFLSDEVMDKVAKCKIIISDKKVNIDKEVEIDYVLIKYNHLIYIVEHSSLSDEIKERLLYTIKTYYWNCYSEASYASDFGLVNKIKPYIDQLSIDEIRKLSREFELNLDTYKEKEIEKPSFNIKYCIDESIPDIDNADLEDIIYFINNLREDEKILALRDTRISRRLNIPSTISEEELNKFIYLLAQRFSSTTMEFVRSLDFDLASFLANPDNNYQTSADINPIVGKYGVFDHLDEIVEVSMADIVGHDRSLDCRDKNILYTFENYFKLNGDGYHIRSLGLLEYKSGSQLVAELKRRNNDTLDMRVREIEKGKYIISNNGLHRFTVLRFHYLLDSMKKEKSDGELREIYKIPVNLDSTVNYMKTYCNYLIQKANYNIDWIAFSNDGLIRIYYINGERSDELPEEKLLPLARESAFLLDSYALEEVLYYYKHYDSFKEFIDKYIPTLLDKIEVPNKEGIKK